MARCHDDLTALTRFVTWDLNERSSGALKRSLPDQTDIVAVYKVAVKAANEKGKGKKGDDNTLMKGQLNDSSSSSSTLMPINNDDTNSERDYHNLLQLMEEAACSRDSNRTNMVVGGLVQHIVSQWRETFSRSVSTKFNCYFLLPFVDEFHKYLREELQRVYEGGGEAVGDVFDLTVARRGLQQKRADLMTECEANTELQQRFDSVSKMMNEQQQSSSGII
jgi:hypothetical protein